MNMTYFEFYDDKLNIRKFSQFSKLPLGILIEKLNYEFNKNYDILTKLTKKEYKFLCDIFFGSELEFKKKISRMYFEHIENLKYIETKNNESNFKENFFKILASSQEFDINLLTKRVKPNVHQINTEFKLFHNYKLQDDDSVYVAYESQIESYKFIKVLASLREFSKKPLEIYLDFKKEEEKYVSKVQEINIKLNQNLEIDFDKIFEEVFNSENLTLENEELNIKITEISKIIKKQISENKYDNFVILKDTYNNLNYFEIVKQMYLKKMTPTYY